MGWEWVAAYLLLGTCAGFLAGLLGVGGGAVTMPVLTSLFLAQGFAEDSVVHLALGTSMAAIVVTSFSSMRAHHARGGVVWPLVARLAPAVVVGSFGATFIAAQVSSLGLAVFFAVVMALIAIRLLTAAEPHPGRRPAGTVELAAVGTGIGTVSALVSIGGGSLTVPYLTWRSVGIKQAIGTSAAVGLPISLAGAAGYLLQPGTDVAHTVGFVYWPAWLCVAVASFAMAPLGARAAHRLPVGILKRIFAVLLIGLSTQMVLSLL